MSLIKLQIIKHFICQCQPHDHTVLLQSPAITEWRKMLSHAVKQFPAFHGFIHFIHFWFINSQGWPKIWREKKLCSSTWFVGGRQKLPIILSLQRKRIRTNKKKFHNIMKSEQKGNTMVFVFHFHYFVIDYKKFKHEKN